MNETSETSLSVQRCDGSVVAFDRTRIERALARALLCDAHGAPRHVGGSDLMPTERDKVQRFTERVVHAVSRRPDAAQYPITIEAIQDQVELALMRNGEHTIARDYVLYRESRLQHRPTRQCVMVDGGCEACQ